MSQMLTQDEALRIIVNHYGQKKQEVQAVQELSELILLLTARSDQRKRNYKQRVTEEIADAQIMIEQIKIMNGIRDEDVTQVTVDKLERQLNRIDKEQRDG